ncbi:MAG: P-II family nitrogen regulator [Verrucomicrobia bacterium]|nr:MAG: P-II family nitrogen regulator [Verrucomicrobiota bacterium]
MKQVKAYIKANKQADVTRALHHIEGLTGASFSNVVGFGRGKQNTSGYNPDADVSGYVRHVKVEVVCSDALVGQVVDTIHRAAHTGLRGDGRIYVSDVESEVRIQEDPDSGN